VVESKVATSYKVTHTLEPIHSGGPVLAGAYAGEADVIATRIGGQVVLRCRETGQAKKIFNVLGEDGRDEDKAIAALALSPTHLFTVLSNNLLEGRDLVSGELSRSWKAHTSPVLCMEHHPSMAMLATGSADHSVRVWNSAQGFCTHNLKGVHGGIVNVVRFHPNPSRMELFSGAEDGSISRWSLADGGKSKNFKGHVSSVRSLDVSPSGRYLASAGRDQVINVWDLETGKSLKTIPVMEGVESLLFLDDDTFVSGGEKGSLRKWSVQRGTCVQESARLAMGEHGISYITRHFSNLILTTSDLHILSVDIEALQLQVCIPGNLGEVTDVAFLSEPSQGLAIGTNGPDLKIFPFPDSLACLSLPGHTAAILCVAVHGDWIVTGSRDNTVCLWRQVNGSYALVASLPGHTDSVGAVCIGPAPNGMILFASASADMTVKLWEVPSSTSPQKVLSRWTIKAHDKDINSLAFSPSMKLLVSGSQDKTAKLWRLEDGSAVGTLKGHKRGIWSVRFSPSEQLIATASADHTIRLWSTGGAQQCLKTLEGHGNSVLRVAFLGSDGQQLLSTGSDGLVKIWDCKGSECVRTLDEHQDRIWTLAMQGDRMATGDAAGCVRLWQDCTAEELSLSQAEQEAQLLMEQDLANMLLRKDFKNALLLALHLQQPFRLFALLNEHTRGLSFVEAQTRMRALFDTLPADKLDRILVYIRDWNTSFKRAALAQIVLNVLLRMPARTELPSLQETCKALLPYSQRHYDHVQELASSAYLVDFVLHHMDNYSME